MAPTTLTRPIGPTPPGQPTSPVPKPRRPPAIIVGPIIVALVLAAMVFGVKFAYGGYSNSYTVSMELPRASQLLQPGSDVRESGVVVGHVEGIRLTGRHVTVTLQISQQYNVPGSAQ